jgi:hypothetical protein
MSSPVAGLDGAIPIRQGSAATPSAEVATPPQSPYVDLRWLGAKLIRTVSYRSEPARLEKPGSMSMPYFAQQATSSLIGTLAPSKQMLDNVSSSEGSVPAQQASVNAVMDMLSSWQRAQHVAP